MFDHLTPVKDIRIKKARNNIIDLAVYFFLLFWAIFLGIFSNLAEYSPKAVALVIFPEVTINLEEREEREEKVVSLFTPQLNLFNFNIKTNKEGINLNKLKVYLNGLYSLEFYNSLEEDLKLYAHGTQLGNLRERDEQGYLYFNIGHYPLLLGNNNFSLVLENNNNLTINNILQFSLEAKEDLVLSYQENIFSPEANYPLEGDLFSFLEKGYLNIYNLKINNYLQLSKTEIPLANFLISSRGEIVYLQKLIINYDQELNNSIFYLKNNEQIISTGNINKEDKVIVFKINNFKLNPKKDSSFQITGFLEEGEYSFSLTDLKARGFFSGQEINLEQEFFLNKIYLKDYFLSFSSQDIDNTLNKDWSTIYDLNIKALGKEVKLTSLEWDFKGYLSDLEVFIDNQYQKTNKKLRNNKLTTEWSNLIIPLEGLNLKLKAKTEGDYLQIYLLENSVSSYNLPNFPLQPNILTR